MKNLFKNYGRSIVALLLVVALSAVLCACDGSTGSSVSATDLTFDFTTGEYSFKGVEGAKEYRVRIFPLLADGTVDELPITETQDIRESGKGTYTGTLPVSALTAGSAYHAYVMTVDEDGNKTMSEPVKGVLMGTLSKITSSVIPVIDGNTITVTLRANALSGTYANGANYEITLLCNGTAQETKVLKNSDITATSDGDAQSPSTTYENNFVTFEVTDTTAEYTVTVKALSTTEYFKDSEVSDPFQTYLPDEVPEEEESTNNGGDSSGGGETGGTDSEGGETGGDPAASQPAGSEPAGSEPAGTEGSDNGEGTTDATTGTESAGGEGTTDATGSTESSS